MKPTKKHTGKARILLVDDHPITRNGLSHLINHYHDLMTCYEARDAAEALEGVSKTTPDLVLTDFSLPDKNGLELIKDIKAIHPRLPILVISMHEESLYANRALRAGARGYISKAEGGERIIQAIRHVLSGKIYVSEKISAHILEMFSGKSINNELSPIQSLSDREFEIFELTGEGLTAGQIAERLKLSVKTVDAHRANIRIKIRIKTTSELIAFAARWVALQGHLDATGILP